MTSQASPRRIWTCPRQLGFILPAILWLAAAAPVSLHGQTVFHGVRIGQVCDRLCLDLEDGPPALNCTFEVGHADQHCHIVRVVRLFAAACVGRDCTMEMSAAGNAAFLPPDPGCNPGVGDGCDVRGIFACQTSTNGDPESGLLLTGSGQPGLIRFRLTIPLNAADITSLTNTGELQLLSSVQATVQDLCDVSSPDCSTAQVMVGFGARARACNLDDGDICTTDRCTCEGRDVCVDGVCGCSVGGGQCVNGRCSIDGQLCGGPCDTCTHLPICEADKDCNDGDPCTDDACNEQTGCCEAPPHCPPDVVCCVADPNLCNDNDPCTDDSCVNGCCVHVPHCPGGVCTTAPICPPGVCCLDGITCNDGNACTDDRCGANGCCEAPPHCPPGVVCCEDGTVCNDGDACTDDSCVGGCCTTAPHCPPNVVCCADGTSCDDGDPCTDDACGANGCCEHTEHCPGGVCGTAPICPPGVCCLDDTICNDGNACTDDACGPKGCCLVSPHCPAGVVCCADGTPCPYDPCRTSACVAGCCAYTPICPGGICCLDGSSCDDDDPCTRDICGPNGCCQHQNQCPGGAECCADDGICDDGDACSIDLCNPHTRCCMFAPLCVSPFKDCPDDGDLCTIPLCTLAGCCDNRPRCPDGIECCANEETCDDGNPCTLEKCLPTGCCTSVPACVDPLRDCLNDGNLCTLEFCTQDGCCDAELRVCPVDANPCTEELCDSASGQCISRPIQPPPAGCPGAPMDHLEVERKKGLRRR